ncbi:amino acid ABC transporter permease [Mesorhizobium loti]|nr:amino acid ABC transporter permease [Mesorhizobium loti]
MEPTALDGRGRPPQRDTVRYFYDKKVRSIVVQLALATCILLAIYYLGTNVSRNLNAIGMVTGFDFLWSAAGFDISWTLIPYSASDSLARVYLVGILNTLLVSALSIVGATVMGTLIGIMRLSRNWLVSTVARAYVEIIRNTPALLQIVFWFGGIFVLLPKPKQSLDLFGLGLFPINNRGFYMPRPIASDLFWVCVCGFFLAVLAAIAMGRFAKHRQLVTGKRPVILPYQLLVIVGLPVALFYLTGKPLDWQVPELKGFNMAGGWSLPPAFLAVLCGLSFYQAASVAELVRAGIQAVPRGQAEAATALGFKPNRVMRLVVLPQALRTIIPSLISIWLNVIKESSLAVAIGFPELITVFMVTSIEQGGHAIEKVAMVMAFYTSVSLIVAGILNAYNRRLLAGGRRNG